MKLIKNIISILVVVAILVQTQACDHAVYDDSDDCNAYYRLHLTYTRNMKWADAFPAEVTHIGVYAFDSDGRFVWSGSETAERLKADGYYYSLPLDPGVYDIVVWCGGKSLEDKAHAWTLTGGDWLVSKSDINIKLDAPKNPNGNGLLAISDLHRLYHGTLNNVVLPNTEGIHEFDIDLTKDTNFIRVILQHADGEPVNPDHFTFRIKDTNASLDHSNLASHPVSVTYIPWAVTTAETEMPDPENVVDSRSSREGISRGLTQISSVIADMTTSRLIKSNRPTIEIDCIEPGNEHNVARLDLISYFLMIKGSANRHVEDQDFLDRQDDYTMMLILDDNNRWNINLGLYINSWRIVLQNTIL